MKRLIYILSFILCFAFMLAGCNKIEPLKSVVCVESNISDDPNSDPENVNDNDSNREITDSEDDDDQDKDENSN